MARSKTKTDRDQPIMTVEVVGVAGAGEPLQIPDQDVTVTFPDGNTCTAQLTTAKAEQRAAQLHLDLSQIYENLAKHPTELALLSRDRLTAACGGIGNDLAHTLLNQCVRAAQLQQEIRELLLGESGIDATITLKPKG